MRLRGRGVFRGAKPPSRLEKRFVMLWQARVIADRGSRIVDRNRARMHQSAIRNPKSLAGWRVIRLGPDEITFETVGRVMTLLESSSEETCMSHGIAERDPASP
jgi:hypothetical protein